VTEEKDGTGSEAQIPGYHVAGKTGTAQRPVQGGKGYIGSGYTSSFVGFVPAAKPRLLVAVILDNPQPYIAGSTAAVTFREVMDFSLRHLGIPPDPSVIEGGGTFTVASRP
jgi:cell division protein FtsI/penicillin-binding protein 2